MALEGRFEDAIENQSRGFRIVKHMTSDPWILSALMARSLDAITLIGLEEILAMPEHAAMREHYR